MYQKYSIGTMAKLMGISAEAIRYYESRNIISPVRDPETGYRYYNTWDFHMLLRARHYQNYGFSLEEIAELFRSHELAEIREKMVDQEEMIQQKINTWTIIGVPRMTVRYRSHTAPSSLSKKRRSGLPGFFLFFR